MEITDREGFWKYIDENREEVLNALEMGTGQSRAVLDKRIKAREVALAGLIGLVLSDGRQNWDPRLTVLAQGIPLFLDEIAERVAAQGLTSKQGREESWRRAARSYFSSNPVAQSVCELTMEVVLDNDADRLGDLGSALSSALGLVLAVATGGDDVAENVMKRLLMGIRDEATRARLLGRAYEIHRNTLARKMDA